MIPSRRLLYAIWACVLLGFAASQWPDLIEFWQGAGLALLAAACADAWLSRKPPLLKVERQLAGVWPVDVWNSATLTLHNEGGRELAIELFDDYPSAWRMEGLAHSTRIARGGFASISYRLCPNQR